MKEIKDNDVALVRKYLLDLQNNIISMVYKYDENNFYDWISGITLNTYERLTVVIRLLDETATPRMTWTLTNAFPKQITPTDMSSQSSEAAIETMVLAHEGLVAEIG